MTGSFPLCLNMTFMYMSSHPRALRGLMTTTSSMPSSIIAWGMKSIPPGTSPQLANSTLRMFLTCSGLPSKEMDTFFRRPGKCRIPASV